MCWEATGFVIKGQESVELWCLTLPSPYQSLPECLDGLQVDLGTASKKDVLTCRSWAYESLSTWCGCSYVQFIPIARANSQGPPKSEKVLKPSLEASDAKWQVPTFQVPATSSEACKQCKRQLYWDEDSLETRQRSRLHETLWQVSLDKLNGCKKLQRLLVDYILYTV